MRRIWKFTALILVLTAFVACQDETEVGSKELLAQADREKKAAARLGEFTKSPEPTLNTPKAGAIGNSPTPKAGEKAEIIEIALVATDPYYEVGGKDTNDIEVSLGTILRITNKDERTRQFSNPDGAFESPDLKTGQTWEYTTNKKGSFQVYDKFVPFATAQLRVK